MSGGAGGHDALLAFLRSPAAHAEGGHGPARVEAIQTHMAWVFVAGGHALKLKKPVRYLSLDYSTVAARETACREEVRLNRRLAPAVYEGQRPPFVLAVAEGTVLVRGDGLAQFRGQCRAEAAVGVEGEGQHGMSSEPAGPSMPAQRRARALQVRARAGGQVPRTAARGYR